MNSKSSIVHECHGAAVCEFHASLGSVVLPCSPGGSIFSPIDHSGELRKAFGVDSDKLDVRVKEFEAWLIYDAMRRCQKSLSKTARLLGITTDRLNELIETNHLLIQRFRSENQEIVKP